MQLRAVKWRPIAFVCLGALGVFMVWLVITGPASAPENLAFDARAYWGYPRAEVYGGPREAVGIGAYRYSPVFVPLMTLWTAIPWSVFALAWIGVSLAIHVWFTGPWWLPLLAFPPLVVELRMANIHILLALAVVLGFRWPAAWSFVLLTKVTPGIGLLWFVVRREWRSLGIALGATALIAGVSFVLMPGLWVEWLRMLAQTQEPSSVLAIQIPMWPRILVAAALVTWGARTDRRWTVPVAATLALPSLWMHGLAMLVGVVAVQRGFPERLHGQLDWMVAWLPGRRMAAAPTHPESIVGTSSRAHARAGRDSLRGGTLSQ
ncbi:MAG: DUF2029 domain-containing protein [Chloroflexi bacterium]|nr:DUF2029 domain-containing protein [Chloroflexota bacterium]